MPSKDYKREVYCDCTLTYCKRMVALDTRYRHRRKMQKLLDEEPLTTAASDSEEEGDVGTDVEEGDNTALQGPAREEVH